MRSIGIATTGLFLSWLLVADGSSLGQWTSPRPAVTKAITAANLPTMLLALHQNFPGTRAPSEMAVALVAVSQWFLYGFVLAWLYDKLWSGCPSKPMRPRGTSWDLTFLPISNSARKPRSHHLAALIGEA